MTQELSYFLIINQNYGHPQCVADDSSGASAATRPRHGCDQRARNSGQGCDCPRRQDSRQDDCFHHEGRGYRGVSLALKQVNLMPGLLCSRDIFEISHRADKENFNASLFSLLMYNSVGPAVLQSQAHVPPNGLNTPKFQHIPKKQNCGTRLLQVPDVQSIPLSLGTQGWPAACLSRQHAGVNILPRGRILC